MADKGDAQQRETNPHVATFATTAVQLGAAALLGGGFYYGIAKQRRIEVEEKEKAPLSSKNKKQSTQSSNVAAKDKVPVIREVTLLERQLGLHKPVTPNAAAWKALAGGTIVSVSGCLVLLFGMGAALGVRNITEFRERMEDVFPRMRKGVARALHIQPKEHKQDSASELAELRELAALFDEKIEEKPAKPENVA